MFGASDGLVSNLALVMGVGAAAGNDGHAVLIAGIAGLLAGAFSMAVGEYISVRSQREVLDYQVRLQEAQLRDDPEAEAGILRAIYMTRGLSEAEANLIVARVMADHGTAVDTFVREEIGLSEATMGSPMAAAGSSFTAFSIGAIIPVIPYLLFVGTGAFWVSLVASTIALFGVGAAVSVLTHRPPLLVGRPPGRAGPRRRRDHLRDRDAPRGLGRLTIGARYPPSSWRIPRIGIATHSGRLFSS